MRKKILMAALVLTTILCFAVSGVAIATPNTSAAAGTGTATAAGTGTATAAGTATSTATSTTSGSHTTAELSWYPADPWSFKDFNNETASRVVDNANLLTDAQETELAAKLADMKSRLNLDFVFYSDVSSYGEERGEFAADFYQFNGYGVGDDNSGVIYFVCMEPGNRGFFTAARGRGCNLITEETVNDLDDAVYNYFVDGDYATAIFTQFNNLDTLFTDGHMPRDWSGILMIIAIVVVVSLFMGYRGMKQDKAAMQTVLRTPDTNRYLEGSPLFTVNVDRNLGTSVVRVPIVVSSGKGGHGGGGSTFSGGFGGHGGGSFSGGGRSF